VNTEETVVVDPPWVKVLMWLGFPLIGAGALWALSLAADWVAGLDWAPFQGPFKLAAGIPEPQATIGALLLGVVGGLLVAGIGAYESLKLTVRHHEVIVERKGATHTIGRSEIDSAFLDGKHLVVLGQDGAELAREPSDLDKEAVRKAFQAHAYAWRDGDPYKRDYRRWVQDDPDLPRAADAFLRARAKAVTDGKEDDARELRDELAKLGVVVRDEKKKQYWRAARKELP